MSNIPQPEAQSQPITSRTLTEPNLWLINDWLPAGHKGLDISVEGGFKTTNGCWWAVNIASGNPIFGHRVKQGSVLIIDEETPEPDLYNWLQRFALGLGFENWQALPITVLSRTGFRFDRKTELDRILKVVQEIKPVFIRIDSFIACVPGGRQGLGENNAEVGIAVRDDLNNILEIVPDSAILLSAHAKKFAGELGLKQIKSYEVGSLVRGHGSIVGEACDTAILIKKISEHPEPTRFVITTRARRRAIPMVAHDVYVELKEQEYGKDWARLEQISPVVIPPSKLAYDLYAVFRNPSASLAKKVGNKSIIAFEARDIVSQAATYTKREVREGLEELEQHKVIQKSGGFTWRYNESGADTQYMEHLKKASQIEIKRRYVKKVS